jgi:hypothetical protein
MHTLTAAPATSSADLSDGHIFGALGAGGIALVLTVILVLGVRGKGKHKLNHEQAGVIGFLAGTMYLAAGQIWRFAGSMTQAFTSIASGPNGPLGDVGLGAVAMSLFAWWWLGARKPGRAALQGIASGSLFAAAGGGWGIVSTTVLAIAVHFGA